MLLVVFGAGASFDSVPHLPAPDSEPRRPPLANDLFGNRAIFVDAMVRFGACRALVPNLRKPGVAVEQELAKFQQQAETFPERYRQLAAVLYYLQFAVWECQRLWFELHRGITNYGTLLDAIERWRYERNERVCFVTFNYDTMLEEAMTQVLRLPFPDLTSYVSRRDYTVIKLHGSVNWSREVEGFAGKKEPSVQELIDTASTLQLSDRYRLMSGFPIAVDSDKTVVFPALSIPVAKKDELSCPLGHREALAKVIPEVTKVAAIGWRATEADFLQMLSAPLTGLRGEPDLMVVSGNKSGANEVLHNLGSERNSNLTRHVVRSENGFTGLIVDIDSFDRFLRASID